ncbi:MAG: lipid A biosynthesis lauroyl acyltransferase [Bauldia sp.]|nr:lipid A biosynthesis lauroyl acyltransferase [Bauldia sp.]
MRRDEKEARRAARQEAKRQAKAEQRGKSKSADFLDRRAAGMMRFLFNWAQAVGRVRASNIAAGVTRFAGRFVKENKLGAANIAAAFPEKSEAERAEILAEVWDNLARQAIEYAFLKDMIDAFDPEHMADGPVEIVGIEHIHALRDSGKAGVIFGAHIGNWELVAAIGDKLGLPVTAPYRPPTNPYIAEELAKRRSVFASDLIAPGDGIARRIARALAKGHHLGILVDQRIAEGQVIRFFGRKSLSNPVVGVMARLFDCPVYGSYSVRLPDGRFRLTMTPQLDLPRDADGRVDAEATNVMVHGMVEDWIRETPGQWLWLHDRWRYGRRKHNKRFKAE